MYLDGRITHGLCGLLVLRHIFKLLGIHEPFEEKNCHSWAFFVVLLFAEKTN